MPLVQAVPLALLLSTQLPDELHAAVLHSLVVEQVLQGPPLSPHAEGTLPARQLDPWTQPVQQLPPTQEPPEQAVPLALLLVEQLPEEVQTGFLQALPWQFWQFAPLSPQAPVEVPGRQLLPERQPPQQLPLTQVPPEQPAPLGTLV